MGQQLNVTGKVYSPSESDYLNFLGWYKSVVLDPKQRDLAMSRYLGPNR